MLISMRRKGDCWDNAVTESLWGSLKVARLRGRRFETRRDAMDEVIDWLSFYNHRRLHSTLGYVSPMQFERAWLAAQEKRAAQPWLWDTQIEGKVTEALRRPRILQFNPKATIRRSIRRAFA